MRVFCWVFGYVVLAEVTYYISISTDIYLCEKAEAMYLAHVFTKYWKKLLLSDFMKIHGVAMLVTR